MKKIVIADATLRLGGSAECAPGFKEKIEIVKALDRLGVEVIETAQPLNGKSDILLLHSLVPLVTRGTLSCSLPVDEELIAAGWEAISKAKHPRLHLMAPVSAAQIEYLCRKKPAAFLEVLKSALAKAKSLGAEVELSLLDATRAEMDFVIQAVGAARETGVDLVTVCDTAGVMLPGDMLDFIRRLRAGIPGGDELRLGVQCSNALHLAAANAAACLEAGAVQFKCAVATPEALPLADFAQLLRVKGRELGISCGIDFTIAERSTRQIAEILSGNSAPRRDVDPARQGSTLKLAPDADMAAIGDAVRQLGYDISAGDLAKVYEEYRRIASKKKDPAARDLDAIVAAVAMQAPPTYKLKSFVITSGNIITAMAHVTLLHGGEEVQGISTGDGPIDAAFLAIETIVGSHFELDDFKINAVTEGSGAVASAIVRLRAEGKLYSGKGVSSDVIGAGIRAYVDALNKICYDESVKS